MLDQPFVHALFHGLPGLMGGNIRERDKIFTASREKDVRADNYRPVNQVEIKIIKVEVFQGFFQCRFNILRRMGIVP